MTEIVPLTESQIRALRWIDQFPSTEAEWLVDGKPINNKNAKKEWNQFRLAAPAKLREVESVEQVIAILFGEQPGAKARFARWYGREPECANLFVRQGRFPTLSYVAMARELEARGWRATPRLWGMRNFPEIPR